MMSEYIQRYLSRQGRWGRIINVSTDAAHAHAISLSYAASKHAIESYSRSAAAEVGKYGITVNIVAPGPIPPAGSRLTRRLPFPPALRFGDVARPRT
jgi:3-oxoacyl-[acyl-carrier protein] reductase